MKQKEMMIRKMSDFETVEEYAKERGIIGERADKRMILRYKDVCEKVDKILKETEKLRKKYPDKKVDTRFLVKTVEHCRKVLQELGEFPSNITIDIPKSITLYRGIRELKSNIKDTENKV